MDGFHYIDIFSTKGIEYLLVIAYLLLFIPFIRALHRGPLDQSGKEGDD